MVQRRRAGLATLVAACLAFLVSPGQANATTDMRADPWGSNHGVAARVAYGGAITNLDGVSAVFQINSLNVPTTCGARYTPASGCSVTGANARPMQLIATSPQSAVGRGEFIGYGYGAGNAAIGNAGDNGTSYRERIYYDGVNSGSNYFGIWRDDVTAGNQYALLLVWYGDWTMHLNGTHRWTVTTMSMVNTRSSMGAESAGSATGKAQFWAGWQFSQWGGGFGDVGGIVALEPHAPACDIDYFTPSTGYGTLMETRGTC